MYAILSGGALVSLCDKPRYVRRSPDSGAYIEAAPEEAIAVAVNGTLYNINGGSAVPGAPEAIVREEDDAAEYVFANRARIAENEQATGAVVVQLEDALCEQDAVQDERVSALEDAVCELDAALNGGGEIG